MAIYCFKCVNCGAPFEFTTRTPSPADHLPDACCTYSVLQRDYKRELASQYTFIPLHMKSTVDVSRSDVLPDQKDFEQPGDSDGSKGYQKWKDSVEPVHKTAWV